MRALAAAGCLALAGCSDIALILPTHPSDQLFRGCETLPPTGACSPAAGAIVIRHRWSF